MRPGPPDGKRKPVSLTEQSDNDVTWGEITPNTVPHLNSMMDNFYFPALEALAKEDWGVCEEELRGEFLVHSKKFGDELK
jgi:hypothetical protein